MRSRAQPVDVFSFLLDAHASRGASHPMLWLPSGACALHAPPDEGLRIGVWHRVTIELDWESHHLHCFADGRPMVGPNHQHWLGRGVRAATVG